MKIILTLVASLLITLSVCQAGFVAKFSGKGYLTQNLEYAISDSTHTVKAENGFYENQWSSKRAISFSADTLPGATKPGSWTFAFTAPKGQVLVPGLYKDATRYGFGPGTNPGMDVFGEGRASNELSGWFNILEIEWDPTTGKVIKAAVDFYQLSENNPESVTKGSIRFNSKIPIPEDPKQ